MSDGRVCFLGVGERFKVVGIRNFGAVCEIIYVGERVGIYCKGIIGS